MRVAWVLLLVGCGRLGFETTRDGAFDDDAGGSGDGGVVDAPMNNPDAMDMLVTFGENPTNTFTNVTRDTYISMDDAGSNFGGADNIRLERDQGDRGLLYFDVGSLPTTATVLSAKIAFGVEIPVSGAAISFHAVNEAWEEGTGDGVNGSANYALRSGVIPWSGLGAYPPSIGAELGTFSPAQSMIVVDLGTALVQGWVTNPTTNRGLLMESNSDSTVRLVSSEGASGMRPVLTVTYE